MTATVPGGITTAAEFEIQLLRDAHPDWTIARIGGGFRADRAGHKSRLTQSAALMMVVLADSEFTDHLAGSRMSGHY